MKFRVPGWWAFLFVMALAWGLIPLEAQAASGGALGSEPAARSASENKAPALTGKKRSASAKRVATKRVVTTTKVIRRGGRTVRITHVTRTIEPARPSMGQAIGLHAVQDPLELRSSVALVLDQRTGQPLFEKNPGAVLPIASITKLMTAMVVIDSGASLTEPLDISEADFNTERYSRSRLRTGAQLTRAELLQLALMASENRAAASLGRHHPGGPAAFVEAMNEKARQLGMAQSRFVEPTGLSSSNVSNAADLARMVKAASEYPLIRQYSTSTELKVDTGRRVVSFRNTNRLVDSPDWQIGLSKTGYISEAGNCLVMQMLVENRQVILVLLDSVGRYSRLGDAHRIRTWLEHVAPSVPGKMTRAYSSTGS